jgi:hypothetical protein
MATQITTKEALGLDDGSTDGTVMASGSKAKKIKTKASKITANTKLPPNPFVFEILELANKQRKMDDRIEVLKEYRNEALVSVLIWNFDDTVVSVVPEGEVPYEKNEVPVGTDHTSLRKEYRNLYHFVKGGNDTLSTVRRETMFIQMLEGLHPDEADILCLVKDKALVRKYPKLTQGVIEQAYPDIQWGGRGG